MWNLRDIFEMMENGKNEEALKIVRQTLVTLDKQANDYQWWLNALGYIYCNLSEYENAIDTYNQYIALSRQNSNIESLHIAFHQKAMALRMDGQYAEAFDCINKERAIIADYFPDDSLKLSVNTYEHGYLLYLTDHVEEAAYHMERSLQYALKTDDLTAQACAYRALAEISGKANRKEQANAYFDEAYQLFLKAGDRLGAEQINQIRKGTPS